MTQPTKNLNETYRFSRDYELLYRLLHDGHRIAGFIDYDVFGKGNIMRDVIAMRYFSEEDRFNIGSRGRGYQPCDNNITVQKFSEHCAKYNIEFIAPTANIVRIEGGRTVNLDTQKHEMDRRNAEADHSKPLSPDRLVEELDQLDRVLEADGYKPWTYARLAVNGAISFIKSVDGAISYMKQNKPNNLEPYLSAEVTYLTSPQTDKLHFHPTDEDQNEQEDSNVRRFRSIENPPQKKFNLRIFEFQLDDHKEWYAAETTIEAVKLYCDLNNVLIIIDLEFFHIIELDESVWGDYKIVDPLTTARVFFVSDFKSECFEFQPLQLQFPFKFVLFKLHVSSHHFGRLFLFILQEFPNLFNRFVACQFTNKI